MKQEKDNSKREQWELKTFKDSVKQWLKENRLKHTWLAANLGKSEGTIRNWLFNPQLNVSDSNQESVRALMKKYEQQESKTLNYDESEAKRIAFIHLKKDNLLSLSSWLLAASVPEKSYKANNVASFEKFARWITQTLIKEARKILKENQERIEKMELSEVAKLADTYIIPLAWNPASFYENEAENKINESRFHDIDELNELEDSKLKYEQLASIPLIMKDWNSNHIALAIAMSGHSVDDFISTTLTDAAQPDYLSSLRAFIEDELED